MLATFLAGPYEIYDNHFFLRNEKTFDIYLRFCRVINRLLKHIVRDKAVEFSEFRMFYIEIIFVSLLDSS